MQPNTIAKTISTPQTVEGARQTRSTRVSIFFAPIIRRLTAISIRTRLLVVYVGSILVVFSALTIFAGGQITSAARASYEQHLTDEVRLVAQGIGSAINGTDISQLSTDSINALLKTFTTQVTDGTLTLVVPHDVLAPLGHGLDDLHGAAGNPAELESALHGESILAERPNESGQDTFYTDAALAYNGKPFGGVIQLAAPVSRLQESVVHQWIVLGIGFIALAALALIAALLLSQSIIQPLYKLRESAIRLSKGDLSYRVGALTWKDEIAEVANAFNEMATQVQSMLEEQRAFASNASHELRTPLTAIRLRTEALRYDPMLDEASAKGYIEEIDDEVAHMGDLVQDLILLSRFDAGRAERGHDQIDIERLASNLFHQMAVQAADKQITLRLQAPDEPITVNASLTHLNVVFRNLLDNALKYTPGSGEIIWTIQDAGSAVIHTIRDSGQGISPEHLPHVFDRFFRADKAHSHNIPGTGLGLSLVKSIVTAYDGQISITSEGIGKGTMVMVTWPKGN